MGLLSAAKNLAAEQALRHLFRQHAADYAELTELEVDTEARSVRCLLAPKGPGELPLDLELGYEIVPANGREQRRLKVTRASTKRVWLQAIARDHLVGRTFGLSPRAASLLT